MNKLAVHALAAAVAIALAAPALADDASSAAAPAAAAPAAAAPVDTYKSVMGQGFEIKSVNVLDGAQQDLLEGKTGNPPAMIVTLQKQQQTAVCYFTVGAWENLTISALDTAQNCSVY